MIRFLLALWVPISLSAQALTYAPDDPSVLPQLKDSVQAVLQDGIAQGAFPGAQLLVAHRGRVVLHEVAGYHTYDSLQAVQRGHLYDLASVTKASSALLVLMQQYGEGRLDLDSRLGEGFPQLADSDKADISWREALAHQGRLRPWVPYWQGTLRGHDRYPWQENYDASRINDGRYRCGTLRDRPSRRYSIQVTDKLWLHRRFRDRVIFRTIERSPLEAETRYRYSGLLFYLLPDYVERSEQLAERYTDKEDFRRSKPSTQRAAMHYATHQEKVLPTQHGWRYARYLREQFYDPLGAASLGYRPLDRGYSLDQIVPTERDTFFRHQLLHGTVHDEGAAMMEGISANAGLFSNAYDLAKLWQMLLQGGQYDGRRYLTQAAVQEFARAQFPDNDNRRGLGFDKPLLEYDPQLSSVAEAASPNSFGHSGYTGTLVWADPEHDILFVFLSNRVYPSRTNRKLYKLNIRPHLMEMVYDKLLE